MAQDNSDGMAKGLIVGFISGGIVGAVLALLYAPKSGRELRADIKDKAKDVVDSAEEYVSRARSRATEIITEAKSKSDTLIDEARREADSIMSDADRIISEAKAKGGNEGSRG